MEATLHYPNLKTMLEVELTLKEAQLPLTRYALLKRLNNKVMKQTLNTIIEYMEERGLIVDGPKGITWTFRPKEELQSRISEGLEA